jgi:drug/metabolite transporter (DMT)-like permease
LAGYYLLATAAFQLAPVAEVALLLSTPPLFVLALRRIRGDIPKVLEVLGAGLAVLGIGFILTPRLALTEGAVNARLMGDTLAVCAALLTASYAYLYRQMAKNDAAPEPASVTLMTFVLGSAVLITLAALIPAANPVGVLRGSKLLLLAVLSVFCTAIPSFAFAFASKRLPPLVTATISLLIPLFAGVFAYLILGEKVSLTTIPGSAFVLAGIVMILRQN